MTWEGAACGREMRREPTPMDSDGTLRVLTLNIAHGRKRGPHQLLQRRRSIRANLDDVAEVIRREGPRVILRFDPERTDTAALIARITADHPIRDLFVENPPIEAIIARLYGDANE